jgi:uncharacterized membrane protein
MKRLFSLFTILLIVACLVIQPTAAAQSADEAAVQAVLFHTPTCPACHSINDEVLEPMLDEYGDRLQILRINTFEPSGYDFYLAMVERFQIPEERIGVPAIVVGNTVLVGGDEIPEQFPSLVEEILAAGGVGWPDIPGLDQAISESGTPPSDPVGSVLAGAVLVGMVVALGYTAWRVRTAWQHRNQLPKKKRKPLPPAKTWAILFLSLVGLGIATYLAYVEITHIEAVCGPIGECNSVQASPYARILGIPVAVLGVLYYLAVGALWAGQTYQGGRWGNQTTLGLLGLTIFGILFSIYLTCLELFVVRATCLWCLGSAVAATVLMLLVVLPVTDVPPPKKGKRHS